MSLTDELSLEALQSAWKTFIDLKDTGIIDFDEWRDSIRRLNCDLTETDIKNAFKSIDKQNSGHIDQTDFIHELLGHNDNTNNHPLSTILQCIIPNTKQVTEHKQTEEQQIQNEQLKALKKVFDSTFDGHNTVSQDLWINKITELNIDSVAIDDLRLFHAVMDSRFRSCFDFDEFYETFTVHSLHHPEMDELRDKIKAILLPKPKPTKPLIKPRSKHIKTKPKPRQKPQSTKKTKEISIQTEMFNVNSKIKDVIKKHLNDKENEYDEEIDDLEQHIIEEEKYLEIMDEIDAQKKRNNNLFKWENAYLWRDIHVINWLNDIGIKEAKCINTFKEKAINGDILLNTLDVEMMMNELDVNRNDALRIENAIFILKNIKDKVSMNVEETKEQNNGDLLFYKKQCQRLNRELKKMGKIEEMFKKNRRETEFKVKQLECNLYFGSLSKAHLMQNFDIDQLFRIQNAHNKTLMNIQQAIQAKVKNMTKKK